MINRFIVFILMSIFLFSCATTDKDVAMDYWYNRSKSELLHVWGAPVSTSSYGHGIEILSYKRIVPAFLDTSMANIYNQFYVCSNGNICYVSSGNLQNRKVDIK